MGGGRYLKPYDIDKQEYIEACINEFGVKDYIKELVKDKKKELLKENVLGVFVRGTDYVALKPTNHPIQPSIDMLTNKIDEYLSKYDIKQIYLVTEDYNIFNSLNNKYNNMVVGIDDYIRDYDGKDYLRTYIKDDEYIRGLNYLIKVLLLNECDYLISSKASGSSFAKMMKKDEYKDSYYFDLGVYKK